MFYKIKSVRTTANDRYFEPYLSGIDFGGICLSILYQKLYRTETDAIKDIETLISHYHSSRYFKNMAGYYGDLSLKNFKIVRAQKYEEEGFESEDEYLDYRAYCS